MRKRPKRGREAGGCDRSWREGPGGGVIRGSGEMRTRNASLGCCHCGGASASASCQRFEPAPARANSGTHGRRHVRQDAFPGPSTAVPLWYCNTPGLGRQQLSQVHGVRAHARAMAGRSSRPLCDSGKRRLCHRDIAPAEAEASTHIRTASAIMLPRRLPVSEHAPVE